MWFVIEHEDHFELGWSGKKQRSHPAMFMKSIGWTKALVEDMLVKLKMA